MTFYADPPRPFLAYSKLIEKFSKVSMVVISELEQRVATITAHPDRGPASFKKLASELNALSVLLKNQGRSSRYIDRYWPTFQRKFEPAEMPEDIQASFERKALKIFESYSEKLLETRALPMTRISTFMGAIAGRPVISIRQLSEGASISEATAKRWLLSGHKLGILHRQMHRGQAQFIFIELVDLIDEYAKTQRFAWAKPAKYGWDRSAKGG